MLLLLMLFSPGCVEENRQTALSGTLIGYITSFDKNQNRLADQSGVDVRIEGSREPILLTTDIDGKFQTDLKTGTYDVILSKDGFCTHKIIGYGFVGGENPTSLSGDVYELPTAVVENLEVKDRSNSFQVLMECKVFVDLPSTSSGSGLYRYYLSNASSISVSNYVETGIVYGSTGSGSFTFIQEIKTSKFPVASDVYLMVAPCTESYQHFIDIETGNLVFSTVKPDAAKVVSFKVPD
ncbi:MAG TPA: hypothetical protein VFW11_19475 [Cyclobacteriaceae bacterium]|nr:hypothetical protein [Cyclobacteriaceae bacterium]